MLRVPRLRLHRGLLLALIAVLALAACSPPTPTPQSSPGSVPLMGGNGVNAAQMAAWFGTHSPGSYAATVPVGQLAQLYLEEGAAEGVRGDIAFAQAIIETGWFRFAGSVPNWYNNFAGIKTADGSAYQQWPDARTGVRAQIQHLRRYADPSATSCTVPPLHYPCVDPRFNLVSPAGKTPTWNQMGAGNWATDPGYAQKVLNIYNSIRSSVGLPPV
jgi:hypothetical protein